MEDFSQYQNLYDGLQKQMTADEGLQIKLKKFETLKTFPELQTQYDKKATNYKMLEFLAKTPIEQWPAVLESLKGIAESDQGLEEAKGKITNVDMELEELQDQLEDLIATAQINQDKMTTKLLEMEEREEQLSQKRVQLQELEDRHTNAAQQMAGRNIPEGRFHDMLQEQREKLSKIGSCKAEVDSLSLKLRTEIAMHRKDCQATEAVIGQLTELAVGKLKHKAEKEWLSQPLALVSRLSCLSYLRSTDDSLVLGIRPPARPTVSAELTLTFKEDQHKCMVLSAARIDVADLDIAEVVDAAVESDDIQDLVQGVLQALNSHAPLLEEIEELRSLYAVDYLHEAHILRVMVGSKGQIICTLKIGEGYPQTGSIQLTSLEGAQTAKHLADLQPEARNPRLKDWVEYLQKEMEII